MVVFEVDALAIKSLMSVTYITIKMFYVEIYPTWLCVCLLWRNVHLGPLTTFQIGILFSIAKLMVS